MSQLILYFIGSFILSYIFAIPTIALLRHINILDEPTRDHPGILHNIAIPRSGGVPIFLAFSTISMLALPETPLLWGILLGGGIIVGAGILDDAYDLSPYLRLGVVWPIASLCVIWAGLTFYTANPFGEGILYYNSLTQDIGPFTLIIPAHIMSVLWIIWVINMVKLSKGASQLPGMAFFAFLTIAGVAFKYAYGDPSQLATAVLSIIMAGAVLGFVPYNFPPERMLPGDSASAFIGFMLAILSIASGGKVAAALIVLSIPAIDMATIIIKRLWRKTNPLTTGGKDHLYHLLMSYGLTKKDTIYIYWITTALLGILAIGLDTRQEKILVFVGILAIFLGTLALIQHSIRRGEDTKES